MLNNKLFRRTAAFSVAVVLALSLTIPAASAGWFDPPATNAAGAILLDPDTGTVYYEKNPDKARPIASMTKLMSLYLVFDAIDDGRLSLDQTIPVSEWAAYVSNTPSYSGHEALKKDREYLVEDLIKLVMTASCNGSMIALGEYLGYFEDPTASLNDCLDLGVPVGLDMLWPEFFAKSRNCDLPGEIRKHRVVPVIKPALTPGFMGLGNLRPVLSSAFESPPGISWIRISPVFQREWQDILTFFLPDRNFVISLCQRVNVSSTGIFTRPMFLQVPKKPRS